MILHIFFSCHNFEGIGFCWRKNNLTWRELSSSFLSLAKRYNYIPPTWSSTEGSTAVAKVWCERKKKGNNALEVFWYINLGYVLLFLLMMTCRGNASRHPSQVFGTSIWGMFFFSFSSYSSSLVVFELFLPETVPSTHYWSHFTVLR